MGELSDFATVVRPDLKSGTASVVLPMGLRIGTTGPGVTTTFSAYWNAEEPALFHFGSPSGPTDPAAGFSPVNFVMGEFIRTTIGPVIEKINEFNPIPPGLMRTLTTRLPIIDKTPIDLLSRNDRRVKLLFDILTLTGELRTLPTTGTLDLSPSLKGESPPPVVASASDTGGEVGPFEALLEKLKNNYAIKLPIIDSDENGRFDAGAVVDILLGRTVDLIRWDPAQFELRHDLAVKFPILSFGIPWLANVTLEGDINGGFQLFGDLDLGLSSRGLQDPDKDGVPNLLDGFFIGDNISGGEDNFELGFGLNIGIGVSGAGEILGFDFVRVRGGGGLEGLIGLDLADFNPGGRNPSDKRVGRHETGGDGRIHLDELNALRALNYGPEDLITLEGQLKAFLEARARAFCLFGKCAVNKHTRKDILIDNFTLLKSEPPPTPRPGQPVTPVLATKLDRTLELNMGSRAALRKIGNTTDGNEVFIVSHKAGGAGDETVTVSAFGLTQEFSGVARVVGDGGAGNDVISIQSGVLSPVELWGDFRDGTGNGADQIMAFTAGQAILHGGGGQDVLVGGAGADRISGDGGSDEISGGPGADEIQGGAGNDEASGDGGGDRLTGGEGDDTLIGAAGQDIVEGGNGSDVLLGDDGSDTLLGGGGTDTLHGGEGNDELLGGQGTDQLLREEGSDELRGGSGDDLLEERGQR